MQILTEFAWFLNQQLIKHRPDFDKKQRVETVALIVKQVYSPNSISAFMRTYMDGKFYDEWESVLKDNNKR